MESGGLGQGHFAKMLMQHRAALYGYIFACVRNHDDAEDILQDVSMAVAQSIAQLKCESGFLPWAREISRRRILAHQRRLGRQIVLDPELIQRLAEAADQVDRELDPRSLRAALLSCLDKLPPEQRRIISLRYDDSFSADDLAASCGRSVQGVYAWVKRIKQLLRKCVEQRLTAEGRT